MFVNQKLEFVVGSDEEFTGFFSCKKESFFSCKGWFDEFETGLNIIIAIAQKV